MTDRDFAFWLTEELRRIVEPVRLGLATPASFVRFLERYGWSPPLGSFDIADVRDAFDVLDDIATGTQLAGQVLSPDDDASPETYVELVEAFVRVAGRARGLAQRPRPAGLSAELWARLGEDLLHGLVADYLESYRPLLLAPLILSGVVEEQPVDPAGAPGQVPYVRRRIRWSRLGSVLTEPEELARELYGWDDPGGPLRFEHLMDRLHRTLGLLGLPAVLVEPGAALLAQYYTPTSPHLPLLRQLRILLMGGEDDQGQLLQYTLDLLPIPPVGEPGQAPDALVLAPTFVLGQQPAGLLWPFSLEFSGVLQSEGGVRLEIEPDAVALQAGGGATVDAGFAVGFDSPTPLVLMGTHFSHRLQVRGWRLGAQVSGQVDDPELVLELGLQGLELVLVLSEGDSLVRELLGDGTRTTVFDAGIAWSSKSGLHFRGAGTLELTVPLDLTIGAVRVDSLLLALRAEDGATSIIAAVTGSGRLGPLTVGISNIGMRFVLTPVPEGSPAGALGDLDLDLAFKPPDGIALALETAAVTGGGVVRFDDATGRYFGSLVMKLADVAVDAVGLVETRLPGGAEGFSFLILMRAQFPPVQVGFGFALTGVGGLVAVNRRVDVDALRNRLASGTAGRILTPEDPIRDAPSLLSDLGAVFPPAPGVTVVGPTVRLVWAQLVHFDVGIFIELPGPARVVVLGSARASIEKPGGGRAYLVVRVDVVGVVDLQNRTAAFDAVLIDSQLLEVLDLTGGAAFRLSWGDQPYAVLTVGGFHPAYDPEPLAFPSSLTRVAMVHGSPSEELYLRFEGYFAVTTNTFQLGAAVEAVISVGSFNIQGILRFDALIRFQPFHFEIDIRASVRVRYKSRNLAGLTFIGALSGPGPVILRGKVCIELLFFDICFEETFTLGSSQPPEVTPVPSAVAALVAELENLANLRVSEAVDRCVVRQPPAAGLSRPVVSPLGQLVWVQRRAPLDLLLQRIGGAPLDTPEMVQVTAPHVTAAELDWFAPGSFAELTDSEALDRRAFERLSGGVRFGVAGTDDGPARDVQVTVRQIRLPAAATSDHAGTAFPRWFTEAMLGRLGVAADVTVTPLVSVHEELWAVVDPAGDVRAADLSAAQAHQLAALGPPGVATSGAGRIPAFTF